MALYATTAVGVMIVVLNIVLKLAIAKIINDMRIFSKSEEKIFAMVAVTIIQFVNTGLILFIREAVNEVYDRLNFLKEDELRSLTVQFYA